MSFKKLFNNFLFKYTYNFYLRWFNVEEFANPNTGALESTPIRLLTIVRNFEGTEVSLSGGLKQDVPNLENHLTCFYVLLNMIEKCLLVSTSEHSLVDELRKDFSRPIDSYVKIPLPDHLFHMKQWTHLAVVLSRSLIKQSQV